jgi:WD40 repeat protein
MISKVQANWSRALQTLEGHPYLVSSVVFSPDGKLVASGSGDKTVRLWEVATGAPHGEPLKGYSDSVSSVTFSLDGKLATTSDWVTKGAEKLLWLPPDYRATCGDVWDSKLVLGHSSGAVSFFQFN